MPNTKQQIKKVFACLLSRKIYWAFEHSSKISDGIINVSKTRPKETLVSGQILEIALTLHF